MRRKRFLLIGLVAALVLFAVVAFVRWQKKLTTVRAARDLVRLAGDLMDESRPFDPMTNLEHGVPPALLTREQAAIYVLLKALEVDEGKYSLANYFLGYYFLQRNCAVSIHYFEKHCRTHPFDEETIALLESIRRDGCDRFQRPAEWVEDVSEGRDDSRANAIGNGAR